jgi:putative Mg2+ transporter-C (MgtC) family protein
MLVSKYGFSDVVVAGSVSLDPSRVAAQIVSGIGFLGAGLIFVRRDAVRGLTTAAGIWFVAAVGMAAGARLYTLAGGATILYLITMFGLRPLSAHMPHARSTVRDFDVTYLDGHGILRTIMETVAGLGVRVIDLRVTGSSDLSDGARLQSVVLTVDGPGSALDELGDALQELGGVHSVVGRTAHSTSSGRTDVDSG